MTSGYRKKYDKLFDGDQAERARRRKTVVTAEVVGSGGSCASGDGPGRRCCCSSTGRPPTSSTRSPVVYKDQVDGHDGEGRRRLARRRPGHQPTGPRLADASRRSTGSAARSLDLGPAAVHHRRNVDVSP